MAERPAEEPHLHTDQRR